ncbi:MAG TPA: DUF5615 family PIN-like protein [Bacillota bacterium]|jgi:predicted nuclease of predicted toxin-antitoxin system
MTYLFDCSLSPRVPRELRAAGIDAKINKDLFLEGLADDLWLPVAGKEGWIVVGRDRSYHRNPSELAALRQYKIGCIYLGGARARQDVLAALFIAHQGRIEDLIQTTEKPFIYRLPLNGRITRVPVGEEERALFGAKIIAIP